MLKLILAVSAAALSSGASAQAGVQASPSKDQPQAAIANPNEVVCQKIEVTGSRLGTKRVCKTRAEWADLQLQDRQELERVQSRRGMISQ